MGGGSGTDYKPDILMGEGGALQNIHPFTSTGAVKILSLIRIIYSIETLVFIQSFTHLEHPGLPLLIHYRLLRACNYTAPCPLSSRSIKKSSSAASLEWSAGSSAMVGSREPLSIWMSLGIKIFRKSEVAEAWVSFSSSDASPSAGMPCWRAEVNWPHNFLP